MYVLTITIGSGTRTPFLPAAVTPDKIRPFQTLILQYGGSGSAYIGDANVSSTNGLALTSSIAPVVIPTALQHSEDLQDWYVAGTAGQKLTVMVCE
jgi:hypothetical protein